MTELANLAEALAAFQAEMPVVTKAKTAKVPTKSGGSFIYTYASLPDVTEAAMPVLTKHGLSFTAMPQTTEAGVELAGMLLHTSGEYLRGSLTIRGGTPQELGGWLTYGRRYLLGCLTGIVTDDDDDGGALSQQPAKESARPASNGGSKRLSRGGRQEVSEAQLRKLHASFNDAAISGHDARLSFARETIGRDLASSKDLTSSEAHKVIETLEATAEITQRAETASATEPEPEPEVES